MSQNLTRRSFLASAAVLGSGALGAEAAGSAAKTGSVTGSSSTAPAW